MDVNLPRNLVSFCTLTSAARRASSVSTHRSSSSSSGQLEGRKREDNERRARKRCGTTRKWIAGAPLHGLPYVLHPSVPLVPGAGVNLVHLGPHRGGGDQEHSSLLVGDLSDDQLLQRNHRRLLVLVDERRVKAVERSEAERLAPRSWRAHHSGEDEALVFLLQEDQNVCEQESQGVCGRKAGRLALSSCPACLMTAPL